MAEIYFIPSNDLTSIEEPLSSNSLKESNHESTRQNESDSIGEVLHLESLVEKYSDKKENNIDFNLNKSTYNQSSKGVQTNAKKIRNQVKNSEDVAAISVQRPKPLNDENQANDSQSIDSERVWHEKKSLEREAFFKSIIQNQSIEFSWYNTLLCYSILCFSSA